MSSYGPSKWETTAREALEQAAKTDDRELRLELYEKARAYAAMHVADKVDDVADKVDDVDKSLEGVNRALENVVEYMSRSS